MLPRFAGGIASVAAACLLLPTSGATDTQAAGSLDPTFGLGGKVTTQIGPANDTADAVAIQRDGRIVVAGSSFNGTDYDFAVVRYRQDGSLDETFGRGGKVTTDIESGDDEARALAIQPNGRIVVAGYAAERGGTGYIDPEDESSWAIVRYTTSGSLDRRFGNAGKVTTDVRPWLNGAYGIALQPNGKIVVAGFSSNRVDLDFALARYNASGSLDKSFGTGGLVTAPMAHGDEIANALVLQPNGKILVAGPRVRTAQYEVAVARYLPNGTLDRAFGSRGVAWARNGHQSAEALSLARQPDGKLVAAGWSHDGYRYAFGVVRFLPNGRLDARFGDGGAVRTEIGSGEEMALGVAVQRSGRIVLAGHSSSGSGFDFTLARYLRNGSLDPSFGDGGKVTTDFGGGDAARAVAVQRDGKIVAAGYAAGGRSFAVARYLGAPN